MQHVDLLLSCEIGECVAMDYATALVYSGNSPAIRLLQALERAAQLAVDVIADASPSRAWILVGWNNLVADRGKSPGFIDSQKSPRSSVRAASYAGSCGDREGRRIIK